MELLLAQQRCLTQQRMQTIIFFAQAAGQKKMKGKTIYQIVAFTTSKMYFFFFQPDDAFFHQPNIGLMQVATRDLMMVSMVGIPLDRHQHLFEVEKLQKTSSTLGNNSRFFFVCCLYIL